MFLDKSVVLSMFSGLYAKLFRRFINDFRLTSTVVANRPTFFTFYLYAYIFFQIKMSWFELQHLFCRTPESDSSLFTLFIGIKRNHYPACSPIIYLHIFV